MCHYRGHPVPWNTHGSPSPSLPDLSFTGSFANAWKAQRLSDVGNELDCSRGLPYGIPDANASSVRWLVPYLRRSIVQVHS
ncbi:Rho GTPase activator (Rgd1), putative [Anopheles sinensis]|uniref:Rho GTPase activator (Rgd1), putative n=1 Tax=Anopheles sinensis TaxID=74873 RepID=A0A084VYF0_ANOSI|nr:Rho GTPase activator (Rgd1), putative [Anopheles sinensis]